jgi:hypothetical protein
MCPRAVFNRFTTARWYESFDRKKPEERVTYCGSNPVSEVQPFRDQNLRFRNPVSKM